MLGPDVGRHLRCCRATEHHPPRLPPGGLDPNHRRTGEEPDKQTVGVTTALVGAHVNGEDDVVFSAAERPGRAGPWKF